MKQTTKNEAKDPGDRTVGSHRASARSECDRKILISCMHILTTNLCARASTRREILHKNEARRQLLASTPAPTVN